MDIVLTSAEIEFYIDTMQPADLADVGTKRWMEWHYRLQKLNQQALVEASCMKDEQVKECLVSYNKVPVLVHEAISIHLWKHRILEHLLTFVPNPETTFTAYTVLFHEAICVALLELILYHSSAAEALNESAADLLDYAYDAACQLLIQTQQDANDRESVAEELRRQLGNLTFEIGLRSLAVLRYLADHLESVTLTVTDKIFNSYDVPVLLVEILLQKPWLKDGDKQYKGGRWIAWDGESVTQSEAQIWLALRQLLLDPACATHYPLTSNRKTQFTKLLPLMQPTLLDQISPLIELYQWLCRATLTDQPAAPHKPILLEILPTIKETLLAKYHGKWKKIARQQVGIIFNSNKDELKEIAAGLSDAYNLDLLEKLEIKDGNTCTECGKPAIQRCSRCKKTWYCCRSCQVTNWSKHKEICVTGSQNNVEQK